VAAIASVSGRLIAPLSSHPDEQELVLLPGTVLLPVGTVAVDGLAKEVVLLTEPGAAPELPANLEGLKQAVTHRIRAALSSEVLRIFSPGRFVPASSLSSSPSASEDGSGQQ
jgi:hypothetical protein